MAGCSFQSEGFCMMDDVIGQNRREGELGEETTGNKLTSWETVEETDLSLRAMD